MGTHREGTRMVSGVAPSLEMSEEEEGNTMRAAPSRIRCAVPGYNPSFAFSVSVPKAPGSKLRAPSHWFRVPKFQAPNSAFQVPGSKFLVPCPCFGVPRSQFQARSKAQGSSSRAPCRILTPKLSKTVRAPPCLSLLPKGLVGRAKGGSNKQGSKVCLLPLLTVAYLQYPVSALSLVPAPLSRDLPCLPGKG